MISHSFKSFFNLLFCLVHTTFSANILFLSQVASPSHDLWNFRFVQAIAGEVHNVTALSSGVDKSAPPNVHYIHLEKVYSTVYDDSNAFDLLQLSRGTTYDIIEGFSTWSELGCTGGFQSQGFQTLLDYPDDFKLDLVIYDFTCGPCLLGFLHKFKYPPLVGVSPFSIPQYYTDLVGGSKQYAYLPYYALTYTNEMNFWQRIHNIFLHEADNWITHLVDALASKGHNITVLSCDIDKSPPPNVQYIQLEKTYSIINSEEFTYDIRDIVQTNAFKMIKLMYDWYIFACDAGLGSKGFQFLLNYPDNFKFDLIVHDFTPGPCLLGFLHKFKNPPLVGISAFSIPPYYTDLVGGQKPYAYLPYHSLPLTNEMDFWQRAYNAFLHEADYWNSHLVEAIANKGHNITVLSCDVDKSPPPNVHYIHLEKIYSTVYEGENSFDIIEMAKASTFMMIKFCYIWTDMACNGAFQSNGVQVLLNYPDNFKFDLIFYDFTIGPCLLGFLHKFKNPPLVGVSAFSIPPYYTDLVGGQKQYAYLPYHSLTYTNEMDLWQRFYNTLFHELDYWERNYNSIPKMDKMSREAFKIKDLPYLGDLEKKTALLLVNSHPAVDYPEPLPPNVILVGGLQVKDPQPLPKDMELFVNSSKKGVVLMSLGTNVRSDMLGKETLTAILETFKQLPEYNFIWKFESDTLPVKPSKNVMLVKFAPQNDILGHPKTKAFISHCGLLSSQEASWYGVPIVGIPFFADQHRNLAKVENLGAAVKVDFQQITTKGLKSALLEVLESPQFRERFQKISKRFQDQPMKPLDTAVWWIEWMLRHPNPDHILSPALKLGKFRTNLFDIYLVLLGITLLIFYIFYKIFKKCFGRKQVDLNKKKN